MVNIPVYEGDRIPLGKNLQLEVPDTPGHSSGSIPLLLLEKQALLTGDLIPRPDNIPIYENPAEIIHSMGKVAINSWNSDAFVILG
jgi:glyoxylase-like metal-dependent hydrolase (beta-lactamase superfamily II)